MSYDQLRTSHNITPFRIQNRYSILITKASYPVIDLSTCLFFLPYTIGIDPHYSVLEGFWLCNEKHTNHIMSLLNSVQCCSRNDRHTNLLLLPLASSGK